MRLARFTRRDGGEGFGQVDGDHVVDVSGAVSSWSELLVRYPPAGTENAYPRFAVTDITFLPPIAADTKIFCTGLNFSDHAAEAGIAIPDWPPLLIRLPDSFVGAEQPLVRPPESDQLDYEGEVALVIGTPGRRIAEADAQAHIGGYTCMAENSVRDWQFHTAQVVAGKNWAASGGLGPWIVTADEVGDRPLTQTTRLNGEVVQHNTTGNFHFSARRVISYISTFTPLRTGDVIAMGTPAGVGFTQDPPRFLRPGDVLEIEVEAVGTLRHTVMDEKVS